MAEANVNTPETLNSVETDAAPSVDFVNLNDLDIGSECEIKTEPKPNRSIIDNDLVSTQGRSPGKSKTLTELIEQTGEQNLETGLGSLNLEEKIEPEVDVNENDYADELMHRDRDGDTLLHIAILSLQGNLACELIGLIANTWEHLDFRNNLYQTPLHLAVLTCQPEVVKRLLQGGASVYERDNKLRTAMMIACEENKFEVLQLLLPNCMNSLPDQETSSMLLNPNVSSLDLPNADGERCLHQAVRHNNINIAKALIENGANPNLPDRKSGRTALHEAAECGQVEMVTCLLSHQEVDVNELTFNGETALELAHMRGREEVVSILKSRSLPITKRKSKTDISTG